MVWLPNGVKRLRTIVSTEDQRATTDRQSIFRQHSRRYAYHRAVQKLRSLCHSEVCPVTDHSAPAVPRSG